MTLVQVCIVMLALAVLLGSARYLFALGRMQSGQRPRLWRVAAILTLQLGSAVLLYFGLFPPPTYTSAERLVILTANAGAADGNIDGRVLALPEATSIANAERVPDLATALRRYPGVNHLRIIGAGLPARDQDAARGLSIEFSPAPLPNGLVDLSFPDAVSAGTRWAVQGKINGIANARVELLDPGNAVVAATQIDAGGNFTLADTARTEGVASYQLRLLDARKQVVETAKLPLVVTQDKALKMLSLAGGPNPELKYLRRWAIDAGIDLQSQVTLGPGMQMDNAAVSINAASLREVDLLLLDERAWSAMGRGGKQAVIDALRNGMGVLLRITGPLSASDRNELRALGFAVSDANLVQGIHLSGDGDGKNPLTLTRRPLRVGSRDAVTLLLDDAKNPLAVWRAEGRGRIGLIWLTDSYKLVLNNDAVSHGQIWRETLATLARSRQEISAYLRDRDVRVNERSVLCNVSAKSFVREPDGDTTYLLADSAGDNKNCAAFWPRKPGWHLAVTETREFPFYVRDAGELPGLQANAIREATLLSAAKPAQQKNTSRIPVPGSPWPWFLAWLLITAMLWVLERSKSGLR